MGDAGWTFFEGMLSWVLGILASIVLAYIGILVAIGLILIAVRAVTSRRGVSDPGTFHAAPIDGMHELGLDASASDPSTQIPKVPHTPTS